MPHATTLWLQLGVASEALNKSARCMGLKPLNIHSHLDAGLKGRLYPNIDMFRVSLASGAVPCGKVPTYSAQAQ